MLCSGTTLFLTLTNLAATGMVVGAGYMALDQTLSLFKQYGPVEGRGNPALDPPPKYWINPDTKEWQLINYNMRGNLVPQVFAGVQYFLIALAIFMTINSVVFLVDSIRSKKAVNDLNYQGKRTGLSRISCTGWLAGYSIFLALMWFVIACFGVIPILMWRITMQRCWDLENPHWSPGTTQGICVDLVQYGLVFFKETQDNGFALLCGPGGNYNPPLGDLEGLCKNYYPVFTLFLVAFAGASISMISMIMFAARHTSNFVYLKVRRWESPHQPHGYPHQPPTLPYGKSLPNPNYEHNVILMDPNEVPKEMHVDSYGHRMPPVGEAMEMEARHYDSRAEGDYRSHRGEKRYSRASSYGPDDVVPLHKRYPDDNQSRSSYGSHVPLRRDESRRYTDDSDLDNDKRSRRHSRRHRRQSSDDASSHDGRRSTASTYRPKATKRRTRGAQSDPDISRHSRKSALKKSRHRDEYESPPSDYYMQEDVERRQSSKSRTKSVI